MTSLESKLPPDQWDPALDGTVAAPNSHRVTFEDDTYRVMQIMLAPGVTEPWHHHAFRSDFILTDSTAIKYYNEDGSSFVIDERDPSQGPYIEYDLEPEPLHMVENLDSAKTYIAWRVEYKAA